MLIPHFHFPLQSGYDHVTCRLLTRSANPDCGTKLKVPAPTGIEAQMELPPSAII
jgi:hypothetical protein